MSTNFHVGCTVLVTEDIGEGQHVTGDLGKIVDFDKDGDPEIFFDAWNKTFKKYRVVLKKMKVISGAEASRLRERVRYLRKL